MNINWLIVPTLLLAGGLFVTGEVLWRKLPSRVARAVLLTGGALASCPAILMAIYYLHVLDRAQWFYQFRSLPFSELAAAGAGLAAGALAGIAPVYRFVARTLLLAMLVVGLAIPYLKPVLSPLSPDRFEERWAGEICRQSTPSSCGAASAATLFRMFGSPIPEKEIARLCYTYTGGTEAWYLARLFRSRGFVVRFHMDHPLQHPIPVPSIAGIRMGQVGHFIPILAETETTYVTGDPLRGREEWPKGKLREAFDFTGFFMEVSK